MDSCKHKTRGFSLIELLVTLAISTLILAGVLFQFRAFDSVVVLKGVAYEIALTLREAQIYSVSSGFSPGLSFRESYGVYFDTANPQQYIFFEDNNNNESFDGGTTDTIIETYTMRDSFTVSQICLDTDCTSPSQLAVTFERPEFDARYDSDVSTTGVSDVSVRIALTDDPDFYFDVAVGITGQISVLSP